MVTQQLPVFPGMGQCRLPQDFQELLLARAVAPDDRKALAPLRCQVVSPSGAHPLPGTGVGDLEPGTRIDHDIAAAHLDDPPAVVGVPHRPVLAAEEPEHRLRHDAGALFDPVKLRHACVLADTGQSRGDRIDRPAPDRRRGREPGRQPRRQPGLSDADLAALRIHEHRRGERQQRQRRTRIVMRRDLLPAGLADLPGEHAAPRLRPRERHSPNVVGPRAAGFDDPADQPGQLLALWPVVAPGPDVPLVIAESADQRGVFRGQELSLRGRRALAILAEIRADRAVLLQIGPVGIDAHAVRRVAVDDVEQMVPAGLGRTVRPVLRPCRGRPRPVAQPAPHVPGHASAGGHGRAIDRFR